MKKKYNVPMESWEWDRDLEWSHNTIHPKLAHTHLYSDKTISNLLILLAKNYILFILLIKRIFVW